MAPEVLNKEEYDQTIDIWALGITCIELAENEPPFFNLSPKEVMKQIIKSPPKGLNNKSKWSNEFNDFISRCLTVDRFKRPSAEELLKHDFIKMIDRKNLNRKLLILQFLSKCGYKVLYSRKIKITPLINGNNGNLSKNKMLYHKKGLNDIRIRNGKMYNSLNVRHYQ
jgi:serine/threonine protein kinase